MHKIEAPGATVDNQFTEGNPSAGVPATTVSAAFLNAVQAELVSVIEAAGIVLETAETETGNQLLFALGALAPAQNVAVFDAAETTEWPVPDVLKNGHRKALVVATGAGGGGGFRDGGGGAGGSAGGTAIGVVDLSDVSSVTVTVAQGGDGKTTSGQSGDPGGTSSFGSFMSATGGAGGADVLVAGPGGIGIGGDINIRGGRGFPPGAYEAGTGGTSYIGGAGGCSIWGGSERSPATVQPSQSEAPGAGGAGGRTDGSGKGAPGIIIVRW